MTITELPSKFTVGDTVLWTETDSEHPAPTWSVLYSFTSPEAQFASEASVPNGADHDIVITTTGLESGRYQYSRKVTAGSEISTTEFGEVEILPDLSADGQGIDRREFAEIALENIEAMLAGKASKDQTSYSLNGRALSRYSPTELREWRAALKIEVADIRAKKRREKGGKSHRNIRASMNSAIS